MEKDIDSILKKYKSGRREELIPLLQEVQDSFGHLSEEQVVKVGKFTGLSTTKIYGLATFYDQFRFIPAGRISIKVCNGTSCFLNGSRAILAKLKEETGLNAGQTSRDGLFSYEIITCMGGCNHGPVLSVNGEYNTSVKSEEIPALIKRLKYIADSD